MKVKAILVADLHLSLTAPISRSVEPNWLDAQARLLWQIAALKEEHKCSVVYAGDIFDRWNVPVELVNWAIDFLPPGYAVPGQHDLPMHNQKELKRSAYWTLVQAEVIEDLSTNTYVDGFFVEFHGFPWGQTVIPLDDHDSGSSLQVAVIHSYIWKQGASYETAPKESRYHHWSDRLEGYDVAVFGDNHTPFEVMCRYCRVYNCGCLIPRKWDERKIIPSVGLLYENGNVERHFLDVSQDKWIDQEPLVMEDKVGVEMREYLASLNGVAVDSLDFRDMVQRYMNDPENDTPPGVKQILLEGLEQ